MADLQSNTGKRTDTETDMTAFRQYYNGYRLMVTVIPTDTETDMTAFRQHYNGYRLTVADIPTGRSLL